MTSWKFRLRYIRFIVTNSGSSATHGPHQVAQTLTTSSLSVSFLASLATPASSIVVSATGSWSHFASDFLASSRLSDHLVEQPKTRVFSTGTGLPASSASMAFRASWLVGGFTSRVVDPADVAQLAVLIEQKHVRRGQHAVGERRLLRLAVVEVRKCEALVLGPQLHVLERIAQVGVAQLVEPHGQRVVRRDGDQGDALVLVVGVQLLDPLFVGLGRRAVVAGEDDEQQLGVGEARPACSPSHRRPAA